MRLFRSSTVLLGLLAAVICLATPALAQDDDLEWPFPEFTKQRSMKIKAELDDAYLKMASERERKYALVILPLDQVGGTLEDVEAAATVGGGAKQLEVSRTTDSRIYMTRGTAASTVFGGSILAFPAEVVVELDSDRSRMLVFYKIDLRGTFGAPPGDWMLILTEAARWALAAEGK